MKGSNQIPILRAALVGFIIGIVASGTYVALGGSTWLFIPKWALILFYPGFVVGEWFGRLLLSDGIIPITIGCITVGTEYAVISVALFLAGRGVIRFGRKPRMPGVMADCEPSTIEKS